MNVDHESSEIDFARFDRRKPFTLRLSTAIRSNLSIKSLFNLSSHDLFFDFEFSR